MASFARRESSSCLRVFVVQPRRHADVTGPLLELADVRRSFALGGGLLKPRRTLRAVAGVSLSIERGEVLGLVGESGCGKSTLARMMLGLLPPSGGEIRLDGRPLAKLERREVARRVQPILH